MTKIYLTGCAIAFIIGLVQAKKDRRVGHDISQFGAVIVVITALSWIYVAYWFFWNNFGGGPPKIC